MSVFLILAALLVAVVLAWLLRPLLRWPVGEEVSRDAVNVAVYRDQLRELAADVSVGTLGADQYEGSRQEIERRLLEEVRGGTDSPPGGRARWGALALGVTVPLCAALMYLAVGTPRALVPGALEAAAGDAPPQASREQIVAMVGRLAQRLKEHPDNAEGWAMLAKSYGVMGRYPEASQAYEQATRRLPPKGAASAQVLADYADVLAMAQGQTLRGEPEKIVARALAADPENIKALALAGAAAFERKNYLIAERHWQRLLKLVPPNSELAQSVRDSLGEAQAGRGLKK